MNPPNYEIVKVLGSGAFGFVFEAFDHTNQRKVALKRIEKLGNQLSREFEILLEVKDSDHIVKILDIFYTKSEENKLIQNIVFEYMETNLESILQGNLKKKQKFPEMTIKSYVFQILKGLEFIHEKNIAHRDLKPENILCNSQDVLKICDFGSAKIIEPSGKNTPYIVSRYYRAPELILCITNYTTAIDIWALGCIFAELVSLQPLFQGETDGDQLFAIFDVLGSPNEEELRELAKRVPFDAKIFNEFKNIKGQNLKKKFSGVFDNMEIFLDLLMKMLMFLPEKRISASKALTHPFFKDLY